MTYDPMRDMLPEHLVRPSWPGGPRPEPASIRYAALDAAARRALDIGDAYTLAVVSEAWRLHWGWYGAMDYIVPFDTIEAARRGRHKAKLRHAAEGLLLAIDLLIAVPAPEAVTAS